MNIRVEKDDRSPVVLEVPGVVFPVQIATPEGFVPEQPHTWPSVEGRLEYVGGRLLFMPPTGGRQFETVSDVHALIASWARERPELVVGVNEPGMKLGADVRAADVAVWRSSDLAADTDAVAQRPPVLAVEVGGRDDTEEVLRVKAAWYLEHGVSVVWLLFPDTRRVYVVTQTGEDRYGPGQTIPPTDPLPDLAAPVDELFRQVSRSVSGG